MLRADGNRWLLAREGVGVAGGLIGEWDLVRWSRLHNAGAVGMVLVLVAAVLARADGAISAVDVAAVGLIGLLGALSSWLRQPSRPTAPAASALTAEQRRAARGLFRVVRHGWALTDSQRAVARVLADSQLRGQAHLVWVPVMVGALAAGDLSPYAPADPLWWLGVVLSTTMLLLELAVQRDGHRWRAIARSHQSCADPTWPDSLS